MAKWEEMIDTAKEETRKELTEEIRDLSILSESEIEIVASTDLDKAYLRDLLVFMNDSAITNEKKLECITSFSGSHLIVTLLQRILS